MKQFFGLVSLALLCVAVISIWRAVQPKISSESNQKLSVLGMGSLAGAIVSGIIWLNTS